MGERLSLALGPQSIELPPAMLALLDELAEVETQDARNFTGLN